MNTTRIDALLPQRPLPRSDAVNGPFFEGAARGELWLQRCVETGRFQFYPRPASVYTGGEVEWVRCSGRGVVHTYSVVRFNPSETFKGALPYVSAMVETQEGALMLTALTDVDPASVHIDMPVEVHFACLDPDSGVHMPFWKPVSG